MECSTKKYDPEEASSKKYVVNHYMKFQMTDDRSLGCKNNSIPKKLDYPTYIISVGLGWVSLKFGLVWVSGCGFKNLV